jgi:hypothetical protein
MKRRLLSTVCLSFPLILFHPLSFSTPVEQAQLPAATPENAIFGEDPQRPDLIPLLEPLRSEILAVNDAYRLRIIYMIPSNRSPQPRAEEELQEFVVTMQKWFSERMELLGYGPKTFQYEVEAAKQTPKVNFVYVAEPDTYFYGDYLERWGNVLSAIANAGYPPWQRGDLMLVVAEMHAQIADGSFLQSSVFFGGAGTIFSGVGMVTGETLARLSDAFLVDDRLYDGLVNPEMGPYPLVQNVSFPWFEGSTLSSTSSSAQGGLLHELGHGLGLWHDFRNDANFNGNLMGNGFRGIRGAIFADLYPEDDTRLAGGSALQLNYSRFFNPEQTFSEDTPPQVQILMRGTVVPQGGHCKLDFTASDADSSLGGAILIRADHVVAEMPLSGSQISSTIASYDYAPGVEDEWYLLVFDTQGNTTLSTGALVTCAEGYNRAPQPYVQVSTSRIEVGKEVILDAGNSSDPDGDSSQLMVEWDLNGDGSYDTVASTMKTYSTIYKTPGIYQIIARLTDEQGDSSVSMPIGIKVDPVAPPLPVFVDIDLKPGNKRNVVNPREKGSIWVAILSDTDPGAPFDPSSLVRIPTVKFGPDGGEAVRYKVKDVNSDGLGDLLLRFRIPETGIACGDTEATLVGETVGGQRFTGTATIKTASCKPKEDKKKKYHEKHPDEKSHDI